MLPEGAAESEGTDEADGAKDPFLPLPFDPDDLEKEEGSVLLEGAADTEGIAVRLPPFPLLLPLPEETTVGSEEIEGDAVERAWADGTRLANPSTNINTAEHQTDFMVDRVRNLGETWDKKVENQLIGEIMSLECRQMRRFVSSPSRQSTTLMNLIVQKAITVSGGSFEAQRIGQYR